MIARYPFGIPEDLRDDAVKVARDFVNSEVPALRLEAAKLVTNLLKVNVSVVRTVATDQVQRHVGFDLKDDVKAEKFAALESMTDEELEVLEKLSERAGGVLPIKSA